MNVFARREIFQEFCRVEFVDEFFPVALKREIINAPVKAFGKFHAAQVGIVGFAPATILHNVARKIEPHGNKRVVGKIFQFFANALVKNFGAFFAVKNFRHVVAVAISVIGAVLLHEGAMQRNAPKIIFAREQTNRQIVVSRNCAAEKLLDKCAVVGVNMRAKIFGGEIFGGTFKHGGEFARTPRGENFSVVRKPNQHGVVVKRIKNFFVEARLKIRHLNQSLKFGNQFVTQFFYGLVHFNVVGVLFVAEHVG